MYCQFMKNTVVSVAKKWAFNVTTENLRRIGSPFVSRIKSKLYM